MTNPSVREIKQSVQSRLAGLERIPMFEDLHAAARHALAAHSSVARVERGKLIAMEGDARVPVYFVLEGLVIGYRVGVDGRAQTLARMQEGEPFYLPCVFGIDHRAPVSTRAIRSATLLRVPQAAFARLAREHPSLSMAVLRELSNKTAHFVRLAGDLGVLGVRARLARLLLELAEGCDPPAVEGTHEDLAAAVGSVREVVSRHLHELSGAGLLRVSRGRVELLDVKGLRRETGR